MPGREVVGGPVLSIRVLFFDKAHPHLTDPVEYMDFGSRNLSIGA